MSEDRCKRGLHIGKKSGAREQIGEDREQKTDKREGQIEDRRHKTV
jgi:hypothetical protein